MRIEIQGIRGDIWLTNRILIIGMSIITDGECFLERGRIIVKERGEIELCLLEIFKFGYIVLWAMCVILR
jgi:hypothetical protein